QNVQGFVPRDAHPLIPAPELLSATARLPVLPHHRVLEPVSGENLLPLGPPASAPPLLRKVGAVGMGVVRLLADDDAVLHQDLVQAAAPAVVPAGSRNPLAVLSRAGALGSGLSGVGLNQPQTPASNGKPTRDGRAPLEERPSIHAGVEQVGTHPFTPPPISTLGGSMHPSAGP